MEELLDNLLFSATLPRMILPRPDDPPTRSERVVHNAARRRLAERYGFEEYQPLAEAAASRCLFRKIPVMGLVAFGAALWVMVGKTFTTPKSS